MREAMDGPKIENFRLKAALEYAARGWHVFPCHHPVRSGDKPKCSCPSGDKCPNIGKHPITKNGLSDATIDESTIRDWWSRFPAANIGIVCGKISGFVVLDEDLRHDGRETLDEQIQRHGDLPITIRAVTGSGGSHILFKHPGEAFPNSSGEKGWLKLKGLDIRGDGGYIVAAPSLHKCGDRYRWEDGQSPEDIELQPVPAWIMNRLRARYASGIFDAQRRQRTLLARQSDSRDTGRESQRALSLARLSTSRQRYFAF